MVPSVRLPLGVSDHPPERTLSLKRHNEAIATTVELHGYEAIDTPTFELLDVLESGLGERARRTLFRMVDPATGEVVVLRPDFTAQVARMVVARMPERPRPLRLFYQGRILRAADPLGRGLRSRDVFQAGAELIGTREPWADLEILSLGARCLEHLANPLTLDLGHGAIVGSMMPERVELDAIHRALASKDGEALRGLAPVLEPLIDLYGGPEVLARARASLKGAPSSVHQSIDELERVSTELSREFPSIRVTFDLGEQRGLGYYTGLFFHGYVSGAADAVLMGGRYDALLEKYGRAEPAVGFAIDVDALGPAPSSMGRRGFVLADHGVDRSVLVREAERRRRQGERAVLVSAATASEYARSNGYRAVLERMEDGTFEENAID